MDPHPHPYALGCKDHGSSSQFTQTCNASFSFGPKFVGKVTCHVTNMNCCGMFPGQPYQYPWKVQYDAFNNSYLLHKDNTKYLIWSTLALPQHATPKLAFFNFYLTSLSTSLLRFATSSSFNSFKWVFYIAYFRIWFSHSTRSISSRHHLRRTSSKLQSFSLVIESSLFLEVLIC